MTAAVICVLPMASMAVLSAGGSAIKSARTSWPAHRSVHAGSWRHNFSEPPHLQDPAHL